MVLTAIIAYVIWRVRGRPDRLVSWLLPAAVYRHKSNIVDVEIFLFNPALSILGVFATLAFGPLITVHNRIQPYVPRFYTPLAKAGVHLAA